MTYRPELFDLACFSCLCIAFNSQVLADKLPELLDFPRDLVSLEAASKVYSWLCFWFSIHYVIIT